MTVIEQFGEISKMEMCMMTANFMRKKGFKDIINTPFKVKKGVIFEEDKEVKDADTGETKTVTKRLFSMITEDGDIVGGDSKTIQGAWQEMYALFGEEIFDYELVVCQYESKSGRKFLQMELKQ